jgi:hypothetical protein
MNIAEWVIEHGRLVNAIKSDCAALAGHLGRLPDPQIEAEVESLLSWRHQNFRLGHEPASDGAIHWAALSAGEIFEEMRDAIIRAARGLLNAIETTLRINARENKFGLFAPSELPDSIVRLRGGYAFTTVRELPPGHPLRELSHDERLPEICLGEGNIMLTLDGQPRRVLQPWRTVASILHEVEVSRADKRRRDELERQESLEFIRREEERRERSLPLEERRLLALERQLADLKKSAAAG